MADPNGQFDAVPNEVRQLYAALAAENLPTLQNPQVAQGQPYISGETCRSVLNQWLGIHAWNFRVIEHGLDVDADEWWCLGELAADIPTGQYEPDGRMGTRHVIHQQFGSQKMKRLRSDGKPMDIGFDKKGAATDALKKCATDIGVGLYLTRKQEEAYLANVDGAVAAAARPGKAPAATSNPSATRTPSTTARPAATPPGSSSAPPAAAANGGARATSVSRDDKTHCWVCGDPIKHVLFDEGKPSQKEWAPEYLADLGLKKWGAVACWTHYKQLKEKKEKNSGSLPPEDLWAVNRAASAASAAPTSATSGRPAARPAPAQANALETLQAFLQKHLDTLDAAGSVTADAEQNEWVEMTLYEAVGDDNTRLLAAIFGPDPLTSAEVDTFEYWITNDKDWKKRAATIVGLLPVGEARAG